jgi:hypothetical protein
MDTNKWFGHALISLAANSKNTCKGLCRIIAGSESKIDLTSPRCSCVVAVGHHGMTLTAASEGLVRKRELYPE